MPNRVFGNFYSKKTFFLAAFFIIFIASLILYFLSPEQKTILVNNTFGRHFISGWRSLRKLPNIVHLPYWFRETGLEAYYINLSEEDIRALKSNIPFDISSGQYGRMTDDLKKYVGGYFSSPADNYQGEMNIRYRGRVSNNWDSEKKALRINFPSENLFNGVSALNFYLPYDRGYFVEPLSSYRAQKMGLLSQDLYFTRLNINGKDAGVYLAAEPWTKEFLAKNDILDDNNIFSTKDKNFKDIKTFYSLDHLNDWKSYINEEEDISFEELETLFNLIEKASDEEFEKNIETILDMEKFYKWKVLATLMGSTHQGDGASIILFKKETGRFEFIPSDIAINSNIDEDFYLKSDLLTSRIFNSDKFYDEYNKILYEYVSDEESLIDDLRFYDNLYERLKPEFYADQAKLYNDFAFNRQVEDKRELIIKQFENAKKLSGIENFAGIPNSNINAGDFSTIGSFSHFKDVSLTIDEFLEKNWQFMRRGTNTVALISSTVTFRDTVVVPHGLRLEIDPGSKLFFAPGVSLVSYSPVKAIGTKNFPIKFQPLFPGRNTPWGVFGVINTGEILNEFSNIYFDGGSEATINGVYFTSQFSLHNTESKISDSIFNNSKSDDAFHSILGAVSVFGSTFKDNFSDGIDFDYIKRGRIEDNIFENTGEMDLGGDAIDIAGSSEIKISGNTISAYGDKCISIGERSSIIIRDNYIVGCSIGIAIKDSSEALIDGNIIAGNKDYGISLYRKKPEFIKGGYADVINSIIWDNKKEIASDSLSTVYVKDSVVKNGYADGDNISIESPNFKSLLPIFLREFLLDSVKGR